MHNSYGSVTYNEYILHNAYKLSAEIPQFIPSLICIICIAYMYNLYNMHDLYSDMYNNNQNISKLLFLFYCIFQWETNIKSYKCKVYSLDIR